MTVPKAVRDALGLAEGDRVVFRIEGRRALLARTPKLLDLGASVPVPAQKRGTPWPESELLLTDLIVAEVVYVLESFYEVERQRVAELARAIIGFPAVAVVEPS